MNSLFARPVSLSIAAVSALFACATAQAATCSDVELTLANYTGNEIKMTQLQYKKDGVWNTKTGIFGVDGYQKLEDGWGITYTINLAGVDGESTDFKLKYYLHAGGTKWDGPYYEYNGTFTCNDGDVVFMEID
jgi:hypothetical protein